MDKEAALNISKLILKNDEENLISLEMLERYRRMLELREKKSLLIAAIFFDEL